MKEMQRMADGVLGFALDPDFATHQENCAACRCYDSAKPATLAQCCLEGSLLIKRELMAHAPRRQQPPRDPHHCSKDEMKRRMRYK